MPLFKKPILSIGKFMASKADGTRQTAAFDEDRLRRMARTTNKMIQAGLHIPGPFDHNPNALPVTELSAKAFENAGYWKRFWVSDETGKPTLWGEIDAPGEVGKFDTPAGKIGQLVKECSLSVRPQFTDGTGKVWDEDPIMHVALCVHAIDHQQPNFELAGEDMALSMSCMLSPDASVADLSILREKLRTVANIFLPETCDEKTLVDFLLVSLQQMELSKTGDAQENGTVIEPSPVFLSLPQEVDMKITKEQAESIVKSGATNPSTSKPYTLEDLGIQLSTPENPPPATSDLQKKVDELTLFSAAISDNLRETKRQSVISRIQGLVDSRRITKEYADTHLAPQVEQISLSFKDGKITPLPLETLLTALEGIEAPKPTPGSLNFNLPPGATIHASPEGGDDALTDEAMDKLANELLSFVQ